MNIVRVCDILWQVMSNLVSVDCCHVGFSGGVSYILNGVC